MKTTQNPISNDVFDTRDLIDYKEFLASELVDNWNDLADEDHQVTDVSDILGTSGYEFADDIQTVYSQFETDYSDEITHYNNIESFCEDLSISPDFTYGESVINSDYFTEYTQELLVDCGYIPKDMPSWIEIDYEATAENVKADYACVSFEGEDYYIRSC